MELRGDVERCRSGMGEIFPGWAYLFKVEIEPGPALQRSMRQPPAPAITPFLFGILREDLDPSLKNICRNAGIVFPVSPVALARKGEGLRNRGSIDVSSREIRRWGEAQS